MAMVKTVRDVSCQNNKEWHLKEFGSGQLLVLLWRLVPKLLRMQNSWPVRQMPQWCDVLLIGKLRESMLRGWGFWEIISETFENIPLIIRTLNFSWLLSKALWKLDVSIGGLNAL